MIAEVMQALMPGAQAYGLRADQLLAVIEGCQMDLTQTRYLDRMGLERYAHLVAGVVGEVSARIFGQTDESTTAYAHRLGLAFQWTNILRDVGEDALRGRIYLPLDELRQFGVNPADILNAREGEGFQELMQFQIDRAQRFYQQAFDQLPDADRPRHGDRHLGQSANTGGERAGHQLE